MSDSKKTDDAETGDHSSPYPVSRLAPSFELVDLAKEIAKADDLLILQANGKLSLLAEQIRGLQEEARKILQETRRNQELHRAECAMVKRTGQIYHLYTKKDGKSLLSMLSPEDWGKKCPFIFAGSFRLESDMSWTEVSGEAD